MDKNNTAIITFIDSSDDFSSYDNLIKRNKTIQETFNTQGISHLDVICYSKDVIKPAIRNYIKNNTSFPIIIQTIDTKDESSYWKYQATSNLEYFRIIAIDDSIRLTEKIPDDYFTLNASPLNIFRTRRKDIPNLTELEEFYQNFCDMVQIENTWDSSINIIPDMRYFTFRPGFFQSNELIGKFQYEVNEYEQSSNTVLDPDIYWLLLIHVLDMQGSLYTAKATHPNLRHLNPPGILDPRMQATIIE